MQGGGGREICEGLSLGKKRDSKDIVNLLPRKPQFQCMKLFEKGEVERLRVEYQSVLLNEND